MRMQTSGFGYLGVSSERREPRAFVFLGIIADISHSNLSVITSYLAILNFIC